MESRVRRAALILWGIVAIEEILLFLRVIAELTWGVTGELGAPANAPGVIYTVTSPMQLHLAEASDLIIPYQGLSHFFDIGSVMAMVSLFCVVLAITKIGLWYAQRVASGNEPVAAAASTVRRQIEAAVSVARRDTAGK